MIVFALLYCRLVELESSLKEGDITPKGYVKRKASLLRPSLQTHNLDAIKELETQFCDGLVSKVCRMAVSV